MATHLAILAWEIPRTEEPGGLQSMGWQRVRHDLVTKTTTTNGPKMIHFSFLLSSFPPHLKPISQLPIALNVKKINKYWIPAQVKLLWDLCISLVKFPANVVILLCFNKHGAILFLKYLVLLDYDYSYPAHSQGASPPQCVSVSTCVRTELSSEE